MAALSLLYSIFRGRRRREKILCSFVLLGIIGFCIKRLPFTKKVKPDAVFMQVENLKESEQINYYLRKKSGQKCVHPLLNSKDPSVSHFFHYVPKLQCKSEENWVFVDSGILRITESAKQKHGNIKCIYVPIIRGNDDFTIREGAAVVNVSDGFSIGTDFFFIRCVSKSGAKYQNVHNGIAYNAELHSRSSDASALKSSLGLSVVMFGLDSVSRMTWLRMLPRSHEYFTQQLGGIVLEGYNIVGDGTPQALLPILTGKTESTLPEARRGHDGAQPVDGHPWIWKDMKKHGYVTQWAEDMASLGTFTYRMLGFKQPPTDHYSRPFYLAAEKVYSYSQPLCLGSEPRHKVFINWMKEAVKMYAKKPKFIFGFHSECSHNDNNKIQLLDDDLLEFLKYLHSSGHLEHTILILMSDHGARFSSIRETVQGKLEERMPYFSFSFPSWFKEKYPKAFKNFKINAHRLSTPFDIHETFVHMLNFTSGGSSNQSSRGISLFKEIPKERTCHDAEIEPHWCACQSWRPISTNDTFVLEAVDQLIAVINDITESERMKCERLRLLKITNAVQYTSNADVLKFKKSADVDGRLADMSDKMKDVVNLYQVTFLTTPGNGYFEATVKHNLVTSKYVVSEKEISRINKYGHAPDCVSAVYPHLRPYCYCKKAVRVL